MSRRQSPHTEGPTRRSGQGSGEDEGYARRALREHMAEATTGHRTVQAIRTATVGREREGQATETLRPGSATRRVSGRRLATGSTRVETTRHAAQSVETPAGAAHGRKHEMGAAAGGQEERCAPIIQGGPGLREVRVAAAARAARLTASARKRRQDTELAEFAAAEAEDHEVVEAVANTAECEAATEARAHGEEGAGNSEAGAEDHEVVAAVENTADCAAAADARAHGEEDAENSEDLAAGLVASGSSSFAPSPSQRTVSGDVSEIAHTDNAVEVTMRLASGENTQARTGGQNDPTLEVFATPTGRGLDDSAVGQERVFLGRIQALTEQVSVLWRQGQAQQAELQVATTRLGQTESLSGAQTERMNSLHERTVMLDDQVTALQGLVQAGAEQRGQLEETFAEVQALVQDYADGHDNSALARDRDVAVLQERVKEGAENHAKLVAEVDTRLNKLHQRCNHLTSSPTAKSKGAGAQARGGSEVTAEELQTIAQEVQTITAAQSSLSDFMACRWNETSDGVTGCQERLASVEAELQQLRTQVVGTQQLQPLFHRQWCATTTEMRQSLSQVHAQMNDLANTSKTLADSFDRLEPAVTDIDQALSDVEARVDGFRHGATGGSSPVNSSRESQLSFQAQLDTFHTQLEASVTASRSREAGWEAEILHQNTQRRAQTTSFDQAITESHDRISSCEKAIRTMTARVLEIEEARGDNSLLTRSWRQQWQFSGLEDRFTNVERQLQALPGQAIRPGVPEDAGGVTAPVRETGQSILLQELAARIAAQDIEMAGLRAQVAQDRAATAAVVTALQTQLHQETVRGQSELAHLRAEVVAERDSIQAQMRESADLYEGPARAQEQLQLLAEEVGLLRERFEATPTLGESDSSQARAFETSDFSVEFKNHLQRAMDGGFLLDPIKFPELLSEQLQQDFGFFIDSATTYTHKEIKRQVTNRLSEVMEEVIALKQHLGLIPRDDLDAGATDHDLEAGAPDHREQTEDWQGNEDAISLTEYNNFRAEYSRWRPPGRFAAAEDRPSTAQGAAESPAATRRTQLHSAMAERQTHVEAQLQDYRGGGDSDSRLRPGESFRDYERRRYRSSLSPVDSPNGMRGGRPSMPMRGGMRGAGAAGRRHSAQESWERVPQESWGTTLVNPSPYSSPPDQQGGRGRPGQQFSPAAWPGRSPPSRGGRGSRPSFGRGREDRPSSSSMGGGHRQVAVAPSVVLEPGELRSQQVAAVPGSIWNPAALRAGSVLSWYFEHKHKLFYDRTEPLEFDTEMRVQKPPLLVDEEYWLGDRTRMAHVGSKEVAKQGVFQLLVRLENKFVIHNVVLQRQRLILLYESFSKVPGLYEELLSTINGEQPGGEGIPWRKIRSLVLDTFSPPDWWAQTLELWRASQVQGSRPGHIWLNEFDHWMSVIQQCLPDHERALPDQFEAKLLRGGVSIRCHNALLGRSVGVDMNDPVQVKTQIRLVCSEYADGLAGEKKDKGELRRAAADSAQAASSARETLATDLGFASQAELSALTQGASVAGVLKAIRTDRDLEAVCKRVHYSGAMADMLHNSGVTESMFQERMSKGQCVLCGATDHRLYTCPNYSQSKLDDLKAKAIQTTQVQMLDRWAGERAADRDRFRSRESKLLREHQVNQLTRAGQNRHFTHNFRSNRAQEVAQGGRPPEDDGALKVSHRPPGQSTKSSRRSARPDRSAPPSVRDTRAELSETDSRSSFSSDNSALSWQFAEAGNAKSGSPHHG